MDQIQERAVERDDDEFDGLCLDDMVVLDAVGEDEESDIERQSEDTDDYDSDILDLTPSITISKIRNGILLGKGICTKDNRKSDSGLLKIDNSNVKHEKCSVYEDVSDNSFGLKSEYVPIGKKITCSMKYERKDSVLDLLSVPITPPREDKRQEKVNVSSSMNLSQGKTFDKVNPKGRVGKRKDSIPDLLSVPITARKEDKGQEKVNVSSSMKLSQGKTFGKINPKGRMGKDSIPDLLSMPITARKEDKCQVKVNVSSSMKLSQGKTFGKINPKGRMGKRKDFIPDLLSMPIAPRKEDKRQKKVNASSSMKLSQGKTFGKLNPKRRMGEVKLKEYIPCLMSMNIIRPVSLVNRKLNIDPRVTDKNQHQTAHGSVDTDGSSYLNRVLSETREENLERRAARTEYGVGSTSVGVTEWNSESLPETSDELDLDVLEEVLRNQTNQAKSHHGQRFCIICKSYFHKIRNHFLSDHLPWYFYPLHVCWLCKTPHFKKWGEDEDHIKCATTGGKVTSQTMINWVYLVNGFLWNMAHILEVSNLDGLLRHVQSLSSFREERSNELMPYNLNAMVFFEKVNGIERLNSTNYGARPPSCVAALLHWSIIKHVMKDMSNHEHEYLKGIEEPRDYNGAIISKFTQPYFADINLGCPVGTDAHLRLDEMLIQTGTSDYDNATCRQTEELSCIMDLIVASFAMPDTWPKTSLRNKIQEDARLRLAIGWNPTWHGNTTIAPLKEFRQQLNMPDVIAAGEIGLDYKSSTVASEQCKQRVLLYELLPMVLESRLPLIIQCHEPVDVADVTVECSAVDDCMKIMEQFLPSLYPVYISMFNGKLEEYRKWIKSFPNVVFGISSVILSKDEKHAELEQVIEIMDEARILLETNGPMSVPSQYVRDERLAHQDLVLDIAEKVASIRLTHRALVMDAALRATRKFFRF